MSFLSFLGKLFSSSDDSSDDKDRTYADWICPYCNYEWREEGNGGLVLGCVPNCPKCGTMPIDKKELKWQRK